MSKRREKVFSDLMRDAIKQEGGDGLVNIDLECGCGLDDLMPCDGPDIHYCVLAELEAIPDGEEFESAREEFGKEWFVSKLVDHE